MMAGPYQHVQHQPYRATRLWNEAMRIFNNGMPRKKHWCFKTLKQYGTQSKYSSSI